VAVDKTGWKAIDAKRQEVGMAPIALAHAGQGQHVPELPGRHIEIAGMLQLGKFADDATDVKRFQLS
jgi:hypothetical protein